MPFLSLKDPPKVESEAFDKFSKPVTIKAGENAEWKLPFSGGTPMNIQWYKNDDQLSPSANVKIETSCSESKLRLTKCQRKDSGEVKIKIKNEFGTTEGISKLIVLGELALILELILSHMVFFKICHCVIYSLCFHNLVHRQANGTTGTCGDHGKRCYVYRV